MSAQYKEAAFENAIEQHLLTRGGYRKGNPQDFDREQALDTKQLFPFLQETQADLWDFLHKLHGPETEKILLNDLGKALDSVGMLNVLRHGFKCFGKLVRVAYFAPAHGMNPDTQKLYQANRLTITRQLKYSPDNEKSLDVVLSVNGLPVVTAELKNPMTGQTVEHAKHQYRNDRDPNARIFRFKQRALVHFAVDPDEVAMTTRLEGKATTFLPFNRGNGTGAGNPDNPGGYRTAYLWEQILARDSLLDLLARFLHLQVKEKIVGGKKYRTESMIFPRYHQIDAVRKLEAHARRAGPGTNYLVQHSAGSGKSNSIGWLAHRLSNLHDVRDQRIFHCVIVVTDRLVLDKQLQDTIYQFEHKQGVVSRIEESSEQLAQALKSGVPIIITTLQKFPFVTEKVGQLPDRNYAVIVDEAHSSQSGETATELKGVLMSDSVRQQIKDQADGQPDHEEEILKAMLKRGKQPNISFFAFTATPKYKTLSVFGQTGPDGKPLPFHLYSMRQAIEEGFILDVLKNYTTYKTYYRLVKATEDDPEVEKRKASKALARFLSLHPHNIAQRTEVIVEHFRNFTRHKIGGRAKAMVVTSSRLEAVRYKVEIDRYIKDKGYKDIKTLVAFSGIVKDEESGQTYTESEMNGGLPEKQLPEKFASEEYQLLLVAEKYQTGFDQPLLHTMYVDKKLSGVHAVQTLSRLNRTCPGKEDTFVLDFRNTTEEIQEAFKPYYEQTAIGEVVDSHQLYELQTKLDNYQVYYKSEVEAFCKIFFKPKAKQTVLDHAQMNTALDPAVDRFQAQDEETQEAFKKEVVAFRNLYAFLAQVIPFQDSDLEKLYTFLRFLLNKLPRRAQDPQYNFDDEVTLKYYRLQKISEGAIVLQPGEGGQVSGPLEVGTGEERKDMVELSELIDILNDRFGTEFTPADQLFFDQIREEAVANETLRQTAQANTIDNFKFVFHKALENLFIERMEQNEGIFTRFMNDKDFQALVAGSLLKQVYEQIRSEQQQN